VTRYRTLAPPPARPTAPAADRVSSAVIAWHHADRFRRPKPTRYRQRRQRHTRRSPCDETTRPTGPVRQIRGPPGHQSRRSQLSSSERPPFPNRGRPIHSGTSTSRFSRPHPVHRLALTLVHVWDTGPLTMRLSAHGPADSAASGKVERVTRYRHLKTVLAASLG